MPVSLFTREWIEIELNELRRAEFAVSLFTREWIEISTDSTFKKSIMRLPLYEGVD